MFTHAFLKRYQDKVTVVGTFVLLFLVLGDAKLEYLCLSFSADGSKLVSLSGIPDFLVTIWYVLVLTVVM